MYGMKGCVCVCVFPKWMPTFSRQAQAMHFTFSLVWRENQREYLTGKKSTRNSSFADVYLIFAILLPKNIYKVGGISYHYRENCDFHSWAQLTIINIINVILFFSLTLGGTPTLPPCVNTGERVACRTKGNVHPQSQGTKLL